MLLTKITDKTGGLHIVNMFSICEIKAASADYLICLNNGTNITLTQAQYKALLTAVQNMPKIALQGETDLDKIEWYTVKGTGVFPSGT